MIASMESSNSESEKGTNFEFGDRSTSDVVVRLRTQEGRDDWLYCHSQILVGKCKYFSDRLSESWPTCQIIDSRNCVEVYCLESEFDHHVAVLRLFYSPEGETTVWHNVKNALGILRVAHGLECPEIVSECVAYLEAVPWEESEEDEILRTIPNMGLDADPILSRLKPVDPKAVKRIFVSSVRFATSSPPHAMSEVKTSAQEQIEYMLTEDDDSPLLTADEEVKFEVRDCVDRLFSRFDDYELCEEENALLSLLSDLLWACQILSKLEIMKGFVWSFVDSSEKVVRRVERSGSNNPTVETYLKSIELGAKVLEAIGYGTVILPSAKRLRAVKIWLPFVRTARPLIESIMTCDNNNRNNDDDENDDCSETPAYRVDSELWQSLESTFVSIILALPSGDQAEILTEWLGNEQARYPDLTEAFEVWCYRSKVAKRRLSLLGLDNETTAKTM